MMTLASLAVTVVTLGSILALGTGARRALGADSNGRVEDAFLSLGFGWAALSWWGVVLAESGAFTPLVFFGTAGFLAVALWMAGRPRKENDLSESNDGLVLLAMGIVTVISLVFLFPPFDVRLEARDPGTYLHTGEVLARDGGITWYDETVSRVPPAARDYFFADIGPTRAHESSRFLGFYIENRATGRVIPQATPVYPVWVAVGYWMAGTPAALAAGGVLTWLAACGLSLLGLVFCGRLGLLAGPLMAAGVITGWFARYSAAETAAQLLIVVGCLALVRYRQQGSAFHGLLAAMSFGLCPLTKAELLVVGLPLGLLFLTDIAAGRLRRRDVVVFWTPLGMLFVHTLIHAVGWLWPYYFDVLRQFYLTPPAFFGLAAVAAVVMGATSLLVYYLARSRHEEIRSFLAADTRGGRILRIVAAVAVVGLTAAGYWLRPRLFLTGAADSWNMANHVELGLGISPVLVFLSACGAAVILLRRQEKDGLSAAAMVLIVLSAAILWERNIIPSPMWSFRRWVPVVLPASYLFGLVAVAWVAGLGSKRRPYGPVAAALLLTPVVVHHATVATWIKQHEQLEGSAPALEELAGLFGPEDAVLFERRSRRGLLRFEAALALNEGPAVYRLPGSDFDADAVRSLAWERSRHGGEVYLITTGGLDGFADVGVEPVHVFSWQSSLLEEFFNTREVGQGRTIRLPMTTQELMVDARVYRLLPMENMAPLPQRVVAGELRGELDIGLWDDPYLVGGLLYAPETSGEHSFRWTGENAVMLLPGIAADADTVVLRVRGNEFLPEHEIEAWLDDVYLGASSPPDVWGDLRFPVPDDWVRAPDAIARLEVRIPAAQPHADDSGSARVLGTRIERVFWARAQPGDER